MKTTLQKRIEEVEEEFVFFVRPKSCVREFLAVDCDGVYHKLQEVKAEKSLHTIAEEAREEERGRVSEKIIRDILYKLMPTNRKNGVSRYVNFEGDHENFGKVLKRYAIENNIPPFNRKKDEGVNI